MEKYKLNLEEMHYQKRGGILCKICEADTFQVLFRVAEGTNKSKYGCHKCIVKLLESKIDSQSSDRNKIIQDAINYLKS